MFGNLIGLSVSPIKLAVSFFWLFLDAIPGLFIFMFVMKLFGFGFANSFFRGVKQLIMLVFSPVLNFLGIGANSASNKFFDKFGVSEYEVQKDIYNKKLWPSIRKQTGVYKALKEVYVPDVSSETGWLVIDFVIIHKFGVLVLQTNMDQGNPIGTSIDPSLTIRDDYKSYNIDNPFVYATKARKSLMALSGLSEVSYRIMQSFPDGTDFEGLAMDPNEERLVTPYYLENDPHFIHNSYNDLAQISRDVQIELYKLFLGYNCYPDEFKEKDRQIKEQRKQTETAKKP